MSDKSFKVKSGLQVPGVTSANFITTDSSGVVSAGTTLPIQSGGTGQTSAENALNALLPLQTGKSNYFLQTNEVTAQWSKAFYQAIKNAGNTLTPRTYLNIVNGVFSDDALNDITTLTLPIGYTRGDTASRPASPAIGDLYFNTGYSYFESYTVSGWFPIAAAPGIPTSVIATNQGSGRAYNNGRASVAFSPDSTKGAPSSYIVTPTPTTSPSTFTGSSSPVTVTGLASSTQYTYTVVATGPYGTSSASSASTGVTATTVPQAPTITSASGLDGAASIAFTANATGGAAISSYTVTSNPGGITATGSSSPIIISGLTNGTAYTFTTTATNSNGTSLPSSASSSVTPSAWSPEGSYDALASVKLTSSAASITFSGIPAGYKHLQIRFSANINAVGGANFQFNGDSGTNYATHYLVGNGSSTVATSSLSQSYAYGSVYGQGYDGGTSIYTGGVVDVLDYSNVSKYKTLRSLIGVDRNGSGSMQLVSSVWLNTSAINSITFVSEGSNVLTANTVVSIYGVK